MLNKYRKFDKRGLHDYVKLSQVFLSCLLEIVNHISFLVQLCFCELFTTISTNRASSFNFVDCGFSFVFIPN